MSTRIPELLAALSLDEKAALLVAPRTIVNPDGRLWEGTDADIPFPIGLTPSSELLERGIRHLTVTLTPGAGALAEWTNTVQERALSGRHGIPVTIASDPLHGSDANPLSAGLGAGFSSGPEPIGLGAITEPGLVAEFTRMTARELRAVGITLALHPMADLATEPRWARVQGTFGEDPARVGDLVVEYIRALQGDDLHRGVAATVKHFPGTGSPAGGEEPHFESGKRQVFPGGLRETHLEPFRAAIEAGAAAVMTGYPLPAGTDWEEVGYSFNHGVVTGLLRRRLGFDGVVVSDFNTITGLRLPAYGIQLPPIAWGVEELSDYERTVRQLLAGIDLLGGEEVEQLVVRAVTDGAVPVERIDESVRRVLTLKERLGLFDQPFVDPAAAAAEVGSAANRAIARRSRRASLVRILDQGITPTARIIRLDAPFESRGAELDAAFRQGTLEYSDEVIARVRAAAAEGPIVLVPNLTRPAVLTPFAELDGVVGIIGEFGADEDDLQAALADPGSLSATLPFDLPRSMAAVAGSREDVPFDTPDPLYRAGHPGASQPAR